MKLCCVAVISRCLETEVKIGCLYVAQMEIGEQLALNSNIWNFTFAHSRESERGNILLGSAMLWLFSRMQAAIRKPPGSAAGPLAPSSLLVARA